MHAGISSLGQVFGFPWFTASPLRVYAAGKGRARRAEFGGVGHAHATVGQAYLEGFALPVVSAAVLIGLGPGVATASACVGWTVLKSLSPGTDNFLSGVAVASSGQAWAVGEYGNTQGGESTLIAHWNGTTWKQVPSPNPAGLTRSNQLSAVAATSSTNAWAVGGANGALILHWNGSSWKQVPSPPGGNLSGVAATSSTDAWAVGRSRSSSGSLTLHWNGSSWKQVPSPPGALTAVTATSPANAWAVGCINLDAGCGGIPGQRTLILHWNGMTWKQVSSPNPNSSGSSLSGVAAVSTTNAWAVGGANGTLAAHWNGTGWKQVPSPTGDLFGAAATSTNIWAVGAITKPPPVYTSTLALHRC